jgi:hypothetical protein
MHDCSDNIACSLTTVVVDGIPTSSDDVKQFLDGSVKTCCDTDEGFKRINLFFGTDFTDLESVIDFILVRRWSSCEILVEVAYFLSLNVPEEDTWFLVRFLFSFIFFISCLGDTVQFFL